MKFYRFELAFDGTPQGVGFLQGVDDIGLSNKKFTALMDPFDELPCPRLTDFESRVLFFFTEEGLKKFAPCYRCDKQSNRTSRLEPFRACSRRALF